MRPAPSDPTAPTTFHTQAQKEEKSRRIGRDSPSHRSRYQDVRSPVILGKECSGRQVLRSLAFGWRDTEKLILTQV